MRRYLAHVCLLVLFTLLASCKHVQKSDSQADAYLDAAKSWIAQGRYRDALEELLNVQKVQKNNKEAYYLLATVYFFGFSHRDEAKANLEQALYYADNDYPEAQNLMGVVLMDEGHPEQSIPYFESALKNLLYETPQYVEQNLGEAYLKLGKTDLALAHLRRALEMEPKLCGAYLPLAKALALGKKHRDAVRTLEHFLDRCDTPPLNKFVPGRMVAQVLYELGMQYSSVGDKALARQAWQTCLARYREQEASDACRKMLNPSK